MTLQSIETFVHEFERNSTSSNIPAITAQFANQFLAAGPQGSQVVSAANFAAALPKRYELFARLGCQSTKLVSVHPESLDTRFILARTRWSMTFTQSERPSEEIVVESSFLLDIAGDAPKIVLYLAHDDIMAILRSRGILPA